MLRTNTDLFRIALLASFGVTSGGCGGVASDATTNTLDAKLGTAGNTNGSGGSDSVGNNSGGNGPTGPMSPTSPSPDNPTHSDLTACGASTPTFVGGVATGLEECQSGMQHRPSAAECPNHLSSRPATAQPGYGEGECKGDADCTASPYGRCMPRPSSQIPVLVCIYGCLSDADCGDESMCVCGEEIGECVSSTCKSDADCGAGFLCGSYYDRHGIGCGEQRQFACQTAEDECSVDRDCGSEFGGNCTAATGTRVCKDVPGVACGRPFVVSGEHRLARKSNSASYVQGDIGTVEQVQLSSDQRKALATAWTEIGLMEHASIAAFARFNLQLLALGAPAELLQDCNQAIADETLHARLAFSLASQYSGTPVGPGRLDLEGALGADHLKEVVELVIVEGCVGETVAALEAAEALQYCTDPTVSRVLERIAADEQRHAELAWQFVSWAVAQDPSLRETARTVFEVACEAQPAAPLGSADRFSTLAYGVLDDSTRAQVRQAALNEVIRPCVGSILGADAGAERRADSVNVPGFGETWKVRGAHAA